MKKVWSSQTKKVLKNDLLSLTKANKTMSQGNTPFLLFNSLCLRLFHQVRPSDSLTYFRQLLYFPTSDRFLYGISGNEFSFPFGKLFSFLPTELCMDKLPLTDSMYSVLQAKCPTLSSQNVRKRVLCRYYPTLFSRCDY